ncbi:MAG: hypothetical protein WD396_06105 [Pseudohongiellaceae bacterium]
MMGSNVSWGGHWLWMLIVAIVLVIPVWRICQRTVYPGWLGILILIPFINLFFLYFIAFAAWPGDRANK